MTWTRELVSGLAQYLENADAGTYNSSGVAYAKGATAIVVDYVPADPDKVLTLTLYGATDDPTQPETEAALQVRARGDRDPRTAMDLDDAVFDALQNLPRSLIGGVVVAGAWRTSSGYTGADENGRHTRSSNYRLLVHRPSLHRV